MVSYTSFMYFRRVIWLSKGYFDSSWLLSLWVGFGLNFLHLIHIPHISKRAVCLYKIILPLSLKSYLILKVHGWYVFGIKTRDENGINLMFPGIQHPFQKILFRCFSGCFCMHMIFLKLFLSFLFTCDLKRETITSMCVLSECWWLKKGFGVEALI